jgi:hypothetical protein
MARKRPENAERDRQRGEEFVQALRAYVDLEKRSGRAKRVTNAAIGKAANIEPSIVTRIMNGDRIAHVGQILAIATALEAPDLLPADMRLGPQAPDGKALNRMSAPATRMPPGLEGFLERHAKRTKVTKRERWYLENSRFQAEPWVSFDDEFWDGQLAFWRKYLAERDRESGAEGENAD